MSAGSSDLDPAMHDIRSPARLKVLQVITHLDLGGAEGVALQLMEGLRDDYDFALFSVLDDQPDGDIAQDMADRCKAIGCNVHLGTRQRLKTGGAFIAAWRMLAAIDREAPDVIHLHCEMAELVFALATCIRPSLRQRPVLRTVHNCTLWIDWENLGRWVTRRLSFTDAVAVSHAAAAADARLISGRATPPVIHNGMAPRAGAGTAAAVQATGAPFRLLFAGRFVHQKGADLVPAIIASAARHRPDARVEVILAGQGVGEAALAAGLSHLPDGWCARIVPPIPRLAERLGDYDAVLMPSRYEGFSLLVLECLLGGVPLVAARAPGLDEALPPDYPLQAPVEDSEALGERLAALLADPAAYREQAQALRPIIAARFSSDAMLAAYAQQYDRTAARLRQG